MKRNLLLITIFFLGTIALLVTGNIIVIGEKIAEVTHLKWMEYAFYGLLAAFALYAVGLPLLRIHRAPTFPILGIEGYKSEQQLKDFGKQLAAHCDYIADKKQRKAHQRQLQTDLLHATGAPDRLHAIVEQELNLRFNGDKEAGILGVNERIKEWAKTVFMITAVSQNSKFDGLSVMLLNYKLIEDVITATGFRPTNRQLFKMYARILTTALITYALSEALTEAGAMGSFAPFDFGDAADATDVDDIDVNDIGIEEQMNDAGGLSVYAVLRRLKVPGIVVSSAVDGTLNALMTLRIGYITRAYLQKGPEALSGFANKRSVKLQAMRDAVVNIPSVITSGSGIVGKKATNLLVRIVTKYA